MVWKFKLLSVSLLFFSLGCFYITADSKILYDDDKNLPVHVPKVEKKISLDNLDIPKTIRLALKGNPGYGQAAAQAPVGRDIHIIQYQRCVQPCEFPPCRRAGFLT